MCACVDILRGLTGVVSLYRVREFQGKLSGRRV